MHNVLQDAHPLDDLGGALLHQPVVAGNVGFAFNGVDDQQFYRACVATEFDLCGKAGATEADDTGRADAIAQLIERQVVIVDACCCFTAAVLAIGLDDDARCLQAGRVGYRPVLDGEHGPGGGCVQPGADVAHLAGDGLAPVNRVARLHQALRRLADVLLQGQHQLRRHGRLPDRGGRRDLAVSR